MKTTNIKYVLPALAIAALVLLATSKVEASYLADAAVVISYLTVGALFTLAALDNRRGSKSYLAR